MRSILVETLPENGFLEQEYRLSRDTRYIIGAFIPYLYMHGAPVGTFTFEIFKNGISVFSQSFNCADIKASLNSLDNYAHVFFPVVPIAPMILEKGLFKARITTSGGYDPQAGFLAWCKQHEDLSNDLDYTPSTDLENPLALRLKVLKQGIYI